MSILLVQPVLVYLPLADLLKISLCSKEHYQVVREHTQTKTTIQIPYDTISIRNNINDILPNAKKATIDIEASFCWLDVKIPSSVTELTILLDNNFLLKYGALSHQFGENFQVLNRIGEKIKTRELKLTHLIILLSPTTNITHKYKTGFVDHLYGEYDEIVGEDHQMITSIDPINFWYISSNNETVYKYLNKISEMIDNCPTLQMCSLPEGFPLETMEKHQGILSSTDCHWVDKEWVQNVLLETFKNSFVRL
jgi:hypothetical protein